MLNERKNIQIENLLDEEILKFTKNSNNLFSNNKPHNFHGISNIINNQLTPNYKKNFNTMSLNNIYNHKNNRKICDLDGKNNISYNDINKNDEIINNTINILNMDTVNKKKSRNEIIKNKHNKNNDKLKKAKSFSYTNIKSKNKTINNMSKEKSIKKINNNNNNNLNYIPKENSSINNLNGLLAGEKIKKVRTVKCSSKKEIWKSNCLMIKKDIDNIKLQTMNCTKNINDIEKRLDKIRKFERNDKLEKKKVSEMNQKVKKLKIKYQLSETIRKKQIDLINILEKEIENMKCYCNHFH